MVETQNAGTTEPEKKTVAEGAVETSPQEEDTSSLLRAQEEKIAKLAKERDMFRTGMFKYKNILKSESSEEEEDLEQTSEEKMRQIVKEELAESELAKAVYEKETIIQKALKENKELKTALGNRSQLSNLPGGSSQESADVKKEFFTEEQKSYFAKREKELGVKIDLDKAAENLRKLNK